jgi:hypothetical protein
MFGSPSLSDSLSLLDIDKEITVKTFLAKLAIEAFDVWILPGTGRGDEDSVT